MPQYIWEGLFSILNVLIPGVVMALFAAYYQNRRRREIQIEGKLAVERIDGYENILSCMYDGQNLHEVSLAEERDAEEILAYFDIGTFHYECPDAFKDEANFDAFYKRITDLQNNYEIYLDDITARQFRKSASVYTHCKLWMDAFCDTEHAVDLKVKKEVAKKHIDWMYKLMGMMMFSHCTRAYAQFDEIVCKQIKNFSLTYHKHWLRKWLRRRGEAIMFYIERHADRQGVVGGICHGLLWFYVGKEGNDMAHIMEVVVQVMGYVHFSDRYTPEEYFEGKRMPDDKERALFGEVLMAMVHKS